MKVRALFLVAGVIGSIACTHAAQQPSPPTAANAHPSCACMGSSGSGHMMGGDHMGGGSMGCGHMGHMGGGPMPHTMGSAPMMSGGTSMPGIACALGSGPLSDGAKAAIVRALADERGAEDRYAAALASFGPVPPFSQTERAERRHSFALVRLLEAHGVAVPPRDKATVIAPPTLKEACDASASAEKKTVASYDELLQGQLPEDVRCVFQQLQSASKEHHLPAFQQCTK
ncbi:MAG: ferritin-like domain-containing protein [Polyangiales bacterium]